jgi:Putative adhesin
MRHETYSTPGPLLLNLELPVGDIEIETAQTEETTVELEALSSSDSAEELVANARIDCVKRGDGNEVIVEVRTRHGISISFSGGPDIRFGTPELRLRITAPIGASLDIRTKSADVQARGSYGAVEIKTASGDLQVEDAGSARIKTASGDVHFDRSRANLEVQSVSGDLHVGAVGGDLRASLVSGDVYVRDNGGSINTNTVSGDQNYEAVTNGRVELKAISGDVTVGVRRGARVYVDANTVSGSTSSEFELGDAPATDVAPSASDRAVELFIKTVSGDIRLERAPAPMELTEQP